MKNLYQDFKSLLLIIFIFFCSSATHAESSKKKWITIEKAAQIIASQHNANTSAMLDEATASSSAIAIGRNIRFKNVLRMKKGLLPSQIKKWSDATRHEVIPRACAINANNPAFDRGLYYTFIYFNTYGEKLDEFDIDKATCKSQK